MIVDQMLREIDDVRQRVAALEVLEPREFEIENLLHYGADPTGATYSTTAINNWLAAASNRGAIAYAPKGTYAYDANIDLTGLSSLTSPLIIMGAGRLLTKFLGDDNCGFTGAAMTEVWMIGFTLDAGDGTGFNGGAAVYFTGDQPAGGNGSSVLQFFQMSFEAGYEYGLHLRNAYRITTRDCWFSSGRGLVCDHDDPFVTVPAQNQNEQYWVENCQFNASNGIIGVDVWGGSLWHIRGCFFTNYLKAAAPAAIAAIRIRGAGSPNAGGGVVEISQCVFESNLQSDIIIDRYVDSAADEFYNGMVDIHDCSFSESGVYANHIFISAAYVHYLHVHDCNVDGDNTMTFVALGVGVDTVDLGALDCTSSSKVVPLSGTATQIADRGVLFPCVTADTTVANTVVETTLYSATIPANHLFVQRMLEARVCGHFSTADAAHQATIKCKIGTSAAAAATVVTVTTPVAAAYTNEPFDLRFTFTPRSVGAGGTVYGYAEFFAANVPRSACALGTAAINTTTACNIYITVTWSHADAGTTITATQATAKEAQT